MVFTIRLGRYSGTKVPDSGFSTNLKNEYREFCCSLTAVFKGKKDGERADVLGPPNGADLFEAGVGPDGPTAEQTHGPERGDLKPSPQPLTNCAFPFSKTVFFEVGVPTVCGTPQLKPGICCLKLGVPLREKRK